MNESQNEYKLTVSFQGDKSIRGCSSPPGVAAWHGITLLLLLCCSNGRTCILSIPSELSQINRAMFAFRSCESCARVNPVDGSVVSYQKRSLNLSLLKPKPRIQENVGPNCPPSNGVSDKPPTNRSTSSGFLYIRPRLSALSFGISSEKSENLTALLRPRALRKVLYDGKPWSRPL